MPLAGSVLFIVLGLSACIAEHPGIKVRMTQNVLKQGVKYLVDAMTAEISTFVLPDVNGSTALDDDEMTYELTNIKIVNFQFENVSTKFIPKTGAQIILHQGNAVINCQCDLDSWLIKDSGSAVLTISGASIFMSLQVRRVDPGVPSVVMAECRSLIQKIDFTMQSGISYVYEALKPHIEEVLRRSVSEQLCSALKSEIVGWDSYFRTLKMNFTMSQDIEADLSLISDPDISEKYADLNLKGQFHGPNGTTVNHSPAPMTLPSDDTSRASAGISEVSVNSLVAAYYSKGSINSILSNASESINVTTSELIAAVPEISKNLNCTTPAKITLYATSCPKVTLKNDNITVNFQGLFQIHAKPDNGTSQVVLEKKILAVLNGKVSMSDSEIIPGLNVRTSIRLHRFQIDKTTSNSKEAKDPATEKGIERIMGQMYLPAFEEHLNQRMLIPTKLIKNPTSSSKQGYELVKMEFNFD